MKSPAPSAQRAQAGVILAVVIGAVAAYKGLESMTSPALPILQAELGASRASIAWVLTGVLLTGPIVTPIVARLGEIWDKRRVLLGVLVIVTIGALVSALSASMPMLIAGQMLQGFGLSTVPLAVGIMRETQSVERTKAGNGIMVGAIFGSTALAMLVSGPIADNLHYSWLFWFPFFLLILIIAAVWWLVPASPANMSHGRIDLLGSALLGAGLSVLLLAFTYAPDWGWTSIGFLALLGAALGLLFVFGLAELRISDPLVDVRLLAHHSVFTAAGLMVMAGFCINAMLVAVPMQIQQPTGTGYGLGASATLTGFMLVPAMLIGTTAPLATWIEHKLGQRTATIVGPVSIAAAAFSLMASAGNFTMVLTGLLLVGFGCGISITQAMNLVVSGVPPERVAAFSGLNFVVKAVGATSGAQIAASILSTDAAAASDSPSWAAFNAVWLMCAGMCIATLILGLTIKNRRSSTDSSAAGAAGTATPRADQGPDVVSAAVSSRYADDVDNHRRAPTVADGADPGPPI